LDLCQREPSFGQKEPRPSVLAIIAAVCLAKAFSCFNATVVAFGHRGNDDSKSLPFPFSLLFSPRDERPKAKAAGCQGADARCAANIAKLPELLRQHPSARAFLLTRSDTFVHTHCLTENAMSALAFASIFA